MALVKKGFFRVFWHITTEAGEKTSATTRIITANFSGLMVESRPIIGGAHGSFACVEKKQRQQNFLCGVSLEEL